MSDKFKNKYRKESIRLQDWDYRWEAMYFVTICTKDMLHYFGNIDNGKMNLSNLGVLADVLWCETKNHAKNIDLAEFVVMPNHIHGIIILNTPTVETGHALSSPNNALSSPNNALSFPNNELSSPNDIKLQFTDKTSHAMSLQEENKEDKTIGQKRFQNIGKNSLSSIIGSYKSAVTKHANRLGFEFKWQARFYEHIIRNSKSYDKITNYIINNPKNWNEDKFYS